MSQYFLKKINVSYFTLILVLFVGFQTACTEQTQPNQLSNEEQKNVDQKNKEYNLAAKLHFDLSMASFKLFKSSITIGLNNYDEYGYGFEQSLNKVFENENVVNEKLAKVVNEFDKSVYADSALIYLDSVSYYRTLLNDAHERAKLEMGMD